MFSSDIERAIRASLDAHSGQLRKGGSTPYVSHPVHVALILARAGSDEITIQAALLHDVVEDCEGWDLLRVEREFTVEVRRLVEDLTERSGETWEDRKRAQIEHVARMDRRAIDIKAADKLHNLSSLLRDLEQAEHPDEVWRHFSRGPQETLEMSTSLVRELLPRASPRLARALESVMRELRAFIGGV